MTEIEELLSKAIIEQSLWSEIARLESRQDRLADADRVLIRQARHSLETIAAESSTSAHELADALQHHGIDCMLEQTPANARQWHYFELSINVSDPLEALRIAANEGFDSPLSLNTAGWEVYRRCSNHIRLTRVDDVTTRCLIRWSNPLANSRWIKRLRPSAREMCAFKKSTKWWLVVLGQYAIARGLRFQPKVDHGEWLGTPRDLLDHLFQMVQLKREDVVLDIGCGDGRVLIEAALHYGCRGVGIESDESLCNIAKRDALAKSVDQLVDFCHVDAREIEIPSASVVFLFLPANLLNDTIERLISVMTPGTRIIAHEQAPMEFMREPERSSPMFSERSISVGYVWNV